MRKLALSVLVAVAAALGGVAFPARAAETIAVHLDVDALGVASLAGCDVEVPAEADGIDGIDVLDAAVASGCIDSYDKEEYAPYGYFVTCINDICGQFAVAAGTYWALSENGAPSSTGASGLDLEDGDTIGFSYAAWTPLG